LPMPSPGLCPAPTITAIFPARRIAYPPMATDLEAAWRRIPARGKPA
jgi:hypothetical protein